MSAEEKRTEHLKPLILAVDDQTKSLQLMGKLLKDAGFDVLITSDPEQVFTILARVSPDLILLDIMIPKIDGFTLCKQIKARHEFKDVPVIFLTALDQKENLVAGLKAGAVDYITKPFDADELIARIKVHLDLKKSKDLIADYYSQLKESNNKYEEEIKQAAFYVRSVLPPSMKGLIEANWEFYPSISLGGDTLNYYWLDENNFVIYMIDVSGHGVVAAILSIAVTSVIRSHSLPLTDFKDPYSVFKALNSHFKMELHGGKYFTIWYGIYNKHFNELIFASAGHPSPLLIRNEDSNPEYIPLYATGNVLGVLPDPEFDIKKISIQKGDKIILFSDGVSEVSKTTGQVIAYEELIKVIAGTKGEPDDRLKKIITELQSIQGKQTFSDDFSILQVRLPK